MPDDDIVEKMARKYGSGAAVADDPVERLAAKYGAPAAPTADPVDALAAKYATPAPVVASPAPVAPAKRDFYAEFKAKQVEGAKADAAFPVSPETRKMLLREKFAAEVERAGADPRVAQGGDGPSGARLFSETFPNIKTQADADYALAQIHQSKVASRTASEVADASVVENVKKLSPLARGVLNTGTTVAGFARAATGGYFGGLIGNGDRKESEHLDKLNAALESADGWTKYLHAGGEGLGAGVGIGGLGRVMGAGKAMAAYGAIATPGGVKERVLGAAEMAAFGKVAQFLTPSTQKMLARLPESLRGPVIAKAIDLSDEFAGGVFSEVVMKSAKGEDITPEGLVFSGFLNAAQASLRKVAVETPPTPGENPGLAALRAEGPPPPPPAAPTEAPARPVEAPTPEVAPEATRPAAEPVAAPIEPARAAEEPVRAPVEPPVESTPPAQAAPEAPAAPREEVIQPRDRSGERVKSADTLQAEGEGKSLSQHVRAQGGINADQATGLTGEMRLLSQKEAATSGVLRRTGGKSVEDMMASAREWGFDIPQDMAPADFLQRVLEDVQGSKTLNPAEVDTGKLGEAALRRQAEAGKARFDELTPEQRKTAEVDMAENAAVDAEARGEMGDADTSFDFGFNAEPPAPKPVEPSPEPEGTSLKNAVVSAERVAHGEKPLQGTPPQTKAEWEDRARKIIAAEPNTPDNLIREIRKKPRDLRPEENAILLAERVNRNRALEQADAKLVKAVADGNPEAIAVAKDNADAALAKRTELDEAGELAGAEWGRGGVARQQMAKKDHSLASILADFQRADASKPLSDADRAEARDLAGKVEKAAADIDRKVEIDAKRALVDVINENRSEPPAPKQASEYGAKNKVVSREAYEATKKALRDKLNRMNVGIDPTILADLAKLGAFHVEAGARSFARWVKAMKADEDLAPHWAKIEPHLQEVYAEARKETTGKDIENVSAKIAEGFKSGKTLDKMPTQVGKIAEAIIRSGVTNRGEIITRVHDVFKSVDPAITRRETMEAISGYGNVRKLDKDPVKVRLREIKGELQQGLKLKDMANDKPPLKSGPQRQAPGDEQRGLIRLVNEAKRRGGYNVRDPETQLRSALDGFRTRMRNSIEDMRRQMKAGKKDVPNRTKTELTDPADLALKAEHDAMVKSFQEMFGKPGMTDAQRVEAAIKATEKSIAELERKVKSGDVFAAKGEEKPVDPRLAAARATRDALREQAADIRASALEGQRSPSEIQEQARKKRLTNQIAFLENAVATGNLDAKPRRPQPPMDADTIRLVARHEEAIKARHEAVAKRQLTSMGKVQRLARIAFLDAPALMRVVKTTFDASLTLLQGGFRMVAHPIQTGIAAKRGFAAGFSATSHAESQARIANDADFLAAKRAKLALGGIGKTNVEEFLRSRWGDKIPVIRNFQRGSTTFMNEMRMGAFKTLRRSLSRTGAPTPREDAAIANFVNVVTGRGGGESRALDALNEVFFAPRWTISRFQTLLGTPMMRGNTARTRKVIALEYARTIGGLAVIYGLAKAAGAEIDDDPDSPNIGSITVGDSRIDPLFGLGQAFTFAKRTVKSMMGKGAASEDINPDFMEDYVRGKLAPIPGALVSRVKGTTLGREEATPEVLAGELTTPLVIGDIRKIIDSQPNPATAAALTVLSWFGARVKESNPGGK